MYGLCVRLAPQMGLLAPLGVRTTLWALATLKARDMARTADKRGWIQRDLDHKAPSGAVPNLTAPDLVHDEMKPASSGRGTHLQLRRPAVVTSRRHHSSSTEGRKGGRAAAAAEARRDRGALSGGTRLTLLRAAVRRQIHKARRARMQAGWRAARLALGGGSAGGQGRVRSAAPALALSPSPAPAPAPIRAIQRGEGKEAQDGQVGSGSWQPKRRTAERQGRRAPLLPPPAVDEASAGPSMGEAVAWLVEGLQERLRGEMDDFSHNDVVRGGGGGATSMVVKHWLLMVRRNLVLALGPDCPINASPQAQPFPPPPPQVMSVWALVRLQAPGRGCVLSDLGHLIANEGWLLTASAPDVSHLLWSFSEDRAEWAVRTDHRTACRVVHAFIDKMAGKPEL